MSGSCPVLVLSFCCGRSVGLRHLIFDSKGVALDQAVITIGASGMRSCTRALRKMDARLRGLENFVVGFYHRRRDTLERRS